MTGLLDFLSTPAGQGLLGAAFSGMAGARRGAPVNTLGAAGVGGLLAYNNASERAQQQLLQNAQLEDIKNQALLRNAQLDQMKRLNQMIDSLLNPGSQAATAALAQGAQIGDQPGGFDGSGNYIPPVKNVGPTVNNLPRLQQAQAAPMSGGGTYGIPRDAIAMDLALNDGKNVADWMFKRGTPDMQVSNGYAYDKNNLAPGFLPQLNVSQDGKATVTTIGPDGLPTVGAPRGAVDTFGQYANKQEEAKAAYDAQKVWDPVRQQYVFVPRAQIVQSNNPSNAGVPAPLRNNNPGALMPGGKLASYPTPEAGLSAMDQNLQAYGKQGVNTLSAVISKWAPPNQNDTASYIADVSKRIGLDPNAKINLADPVQRHLISAGIIAHENGTKSVWNNQGPMAAEPSYPEQARGAAGTKQAEADVTPIETRRNSIANLNQILGTIDQVMNHPGLAQGTGLQGVLDPRNYFPGTTAKDFQVAASQLHGQAFLGAYERLRGSGQISNTEGDKAEDALARLNRAQTTDSYVKALGDFRSVISGALERAKLAMPQGQATDFPGDMAPKTQGIGSDLQAAAAAELARRRKGK